MNGTTTLEGRTGSGPEQAASRRTRTGRVVPLALQLLGAVLVVSSVFLGVFATHAGASALSNGTVALETSSGSTATNPLANNQVVTVSVGPNSTLSQSSLEAAGFPSGVVGLKVIQCADPGGQLANLPQNLDSCSASTLINGGGAQQNGSASIEGVTIYTVPDVAALGPSNGTMCDAQHECVLGIFSNQENFSKPHLFSSPFFVTGGTGTPSTSSSAAKPSSTSDSQSAAAGASPVVSVPPATLADTGASNLWPWLLGAGCILLLAGSGLRYLRRLRYEGRS